MSIEAYSVDIFILNKNWTL